jgi:hypothetical protein
VVLVMNLMTEPGETDGLTAAGHLRVLREHVPGLPLHDVLVNRSSIPEERRRSYRSAGALPVLLDMDRECGPACRVVYADLLSAGSRVRHDPAKLGAALLDLAVAASQGLDVALAAPSAEQIAFQQTRVSVRNAVQAAVMPDRESVV